MRTLRLALFALLWAPVLTFALSNEVTVFEASGTVQDQRPVTVSRVFIKGEIGTCPQAYVSGTALLTQADVKTRWDDGSVQHAIISFRVPSLPANGSAKVEFRDQLSCNNTGYLDKTAALAVPWEAQIAAAADGVSNSVDARAILSACTDISISLEDLQCRYWLRGPVVTQFIVEDRTNRTYDFGWEYDSVAGIWKAPTQSRYRSLHPIFVITLYPDTPTTGEYAVRVDYILENTWADRFQTQLYTFSLLGGSPAVPVYTLSTNWRHVPKSRWRIVRWVRNAPGNVVVDFGLPYLIASKALPQYDLNIKMNTTSLDTELYNYWTSRSSVSGEPGLCDMTSPYCMLWQKAMGTAGGRGEIAPIPKWYAGFMYAMGDANWSVGKRMDMWNRFVIGLGQAVGGAGIHYREPLTDRCFERPDGGSTSKLFDGTCAANAYGKVLSINARPTGFTQRNNNNETAFVLTDANDRLSYACTSTTDPCQVPTQSSAAANLWAWEDSPASGHLPDWVYTPYLLSGEWYFLEEMWFDSAFQLSSRNPKAKIYLTDQDF